MKVTKEDIGKSFYPMDNSYSKCLEDDSYLGLAGDLYFEFPKLVKILTSPFEMNVETFGLHEFVIVEYNDKKYLVLNNFHSNKKEYILRTANRYGSDELHLFKALSFHIPLNYAF